MVYPIKFICFVLMIGMSSAATAGFRCTNGKLISEGDIKSEVKIKCGQPVDQEYVGVIKINKEHINLDRWTYNPGTGKLLKILDFHNGVLAEINDGPRM